MTRQLLVVGLSLCLPLVASAQDKIAIKMKHAGAGDASMIAKESKKIEKIVVADGTGNVLQDKSETVYETSKYKETTVAKKAGARATKVTREYSEAGRKVDDAVSKHAYHGKTVVIEQKGEDYTFSVDGKTLATEEVTEIARNFDKNKATDEVFDKLMMPSDKVAVGDAWKVDAEKFVTLLGEKNDETAKMFDAKNAKASGKLLKAYKKEGKQYGIVEYEFNIPLKFLQGKLPCKEGSLMTMKISMDGCLDGSEENFSGTMEMKLAGTAEVVEDDKPTGVTVKFDIQNTEKNLTTPAK